MAGVIINGMGKREQFLQAKQLLNKLSIQVPGGPAPVLSASAVAGATLTQSYLRLIQPLTGGVNTINFPVLYNRTGAGLPTRSDEIRLKLQDGFFVAEIRMYIFIATGANAFTYRPVTYPSPVLFALGGAGGATSAPLNTLYNGYVSIAVDRAVTVPNYPTLNFLEVPRTQLTAAANSPQDSLDGAVKQPWEPNVLFMGVSDTQLVLNMPAGIPSGSVDANTYIMFDINGVLAQNIGLGATTN